MLGTLLLSLYEDLAIDEAAYVYQEFREVDLQAGIQAGGRVQSGIVILRPGKTREATRYVAYIRASWRVGYYLFRRARPEGERVYRDLGRLVLMLQEDFGIQTPVRVYRAGSPALKIFEGIQPCDREKGDSYYKDALRPDRKLPSPHGADPAADDIDPDAVGEEPEGPEEENDN